jgi:AbrB family looped-hinge helix DNA binding protein
MKTKVSSKGRIVLPAELRRMDRVHPGQQFDIERLGRGDYRLVRREHPQNEGVIDWLLACPFKGFFVVADFEATDRARPLACVKSTRSLAVKTVG